MRLYLCHELYTMKKSIILLVGIVTIMFTPIYAKSGNSLLPKKKSTGQYDKQNWLFGPNIGLGGGSRSFSLFLAPTMAYAFTNKFHAGSTLGFNYFQQTLDYKNILTNFPERYRFKMPVYSLSVFGRYHIANMLMLNVEPQLTLSKFVSNRPWNYNPNDFDMSTGKFVEKKQRALIPSFLVGGGYAQHFGRHGYTFMMVNYDLVQNPNSIYYGTLDIRFGVLLDLFNK